MQNVATLTTPAGPGLRERKKAATRAALVDAAQTLVEERGLDAVTVEAVCEAAGVSSRTFFNYFEAKDDAVLAHAPWSLDPALAGAFVGGGPTGGLADDLGHLVAGVLSAGVGDLGRVARGMALARTEPRLLQRHLVLLDRHKDELVALVAQRVGDDPHRAATASVLALTLAHAAFQRYDADPAHPPGEHVLPVLAELRALLTE
ncbi:TetR/AcrR family transcriptional regulator [Cellulomonas endophytica]|uniref:TetR/AcrR family transcriptional regulator n=1 Tax=Cellulomonas endophytica TaxID=2494735 RepID=UPI001012F9DB|nr:TetR/AcrR family transcriptional regulator [Cellulomonas endophytica]